MIEQIINIDAKETERLADLKNLLELKPVLLPKGRALRGKNWFFGWPVAIKVKNTIAVVFYQIPSHSLQYSHDKYSTKAAIIFSKDDARTWSAPLDLRSFISGEIILGRLGFGNAIGSLPGGSAVVITSYGVFRSGVDGTRWQHVNGAYQNSQFSSQSVGLNHGPKLEYLPSVGLVSASHTPLANGGVADQICLRFSKNKGENWIESIFHLPAFVKPVEPTLFVVDGKLCALARSHGSFDVASRTWRYVQLIFESDFSSVQAIATNITATDTVAFSQRPGFGPWSQDTADVILNPITNRIEAVVTNRSGGGEGEELVISHQTLNLWSIAPQELLSGSAQWKFEGTLLRRVGTPSDKLYPVDGMHPGASVLDIKKKVQHIFIYLGYRPGPSGIFRITRTLDTKSLSDKLLAAPSQ